VETTAHRVLRPLQQGFLLPGAVSGILLFPHCCPSQGCLPG
jgi:hypothetical protein